MDTKQPDPAQFTHSLRCCRFEQDLKSADAYAGRLEDAGGEAIRLIREMMSDCEISWSDLQDRILEVEDKWKRARMSKPITGEIVPAAVNTEHNGESVDALRKELAEVSRELHRIVQHFDPDGDYVGVESSDSAGAYGVLISEVRKVHDNMGTRRLLSVLKGGPL